jgi:hypothetical protein
MSTPQRPEPQPVRIVGIGSGNKPVPVPLSKEESRWASLGCLALLGVMAFLGWILTILPGRVTGYIVFMTVFIVGLAAWRAGIRKANGG